MPKRTKAITCPQCGAAVDYEAGAREVIGCDYCGATVVISKTAAPVSNTKTDPRPKMRTAWDQYRENYRKVLERTGTSPAEGPDATPRPILPYVVLGMVILLVGAAFVSLIPSMDLLHRPLSETKPKREARVPVAKPSPPAAIRYSVTVESRRSNEVDHLETPEIDESELPSLEEAELRRTVFKDPVVKVKVFVSSAGDVMLAEGLAGHDTLQRAAIRAARKTMFKPRSPAGNLLLTYRFTLISVK